MEKLTSMDVNTAIQRSTAKAIAMHGLGLSLWIGEDTIITTPASNVVSKNPLPTKQKSVQLNIGDANWDRVMKYVIDNKDKGLKFIGEQLTKKYKMSTIVKKEIAKAI